MGAPLHKKLKYANSRLQKDEQDQVGDISQSSVHVDAAGCDVGVHRRLRSAAQKKLLTTRIHYARSHLHARDLNKLGERKKNEMGLLYALYVLCELYVSWPVVRCGVRVVIRSSWGKRFFVLKIRTLSGTMFFFINI